MAQGFCPRAPWMCWHAVGSAAGRPPANSVDLRQRRSSVSPLIPMVVEQTSRGERAFDIYSRLLARCLCRDRPTRGGAAARSRRSRSGRPPVCRERRCARSLKQAPLGRKARRGRVPQTSATSSAGKDYDVRSKTWRTVAASHCLPPCPVGTLIAFKSLASSPRGRRVRRSGSEPANSARCRPAQTAS
jgi:hypothetical protein